MRWKRAVGYWWRGTPSHRISNFGDALAPLLLEHFGNIRATWAPVSQAKIITVGSVLEHVPPEWDGHILGAGQLYEDSRLHLHTGTATIWALRGPLTARNVPGDYALGDPGLLADELVSVDHRDVDLGIVPHWSDRSLAHRPEFYGKSWRTNVIDVSADPMAVIAEIGRCKKIVTSSLHGMVVADAFGIPRRFDMNPTATRFEGGLFKFQDYSASIGAKFEPGKIIEASRFLVEDRKHALYDAFVDLGRSSACLF